MKRVVLPKAEKKEPTALDKEHLGQFLAIFAKTRLYSLLVTAASTGCRRGELLALKWTDLDFETGVMTVSKSLEQTRDCIRVKTTKSGVTRRLPLPPICLDVLLRHRQVQDRENALRRSEYKDLDLVFARPDGTYYPPDQISPWVADITKKFGWAGVSLHSLRHTHASQLLSQCVPIPVVSKRLGHANPSITLKLYSHALQADELAAAKIWNDAMVDILVSSTETSSGDQMLANVRRLRPPRSQKS